MKSGVRGDTPPRHRCQLRADARNGRRSLGGAWMFHVTEKQLRHGDGSQVTSVSGSGRLAMGISGLARKF
jgi:hypothetical protein